MGVGEGLSLWSFELRSDKKEWDTSAYFRMSLEDIIHKKNI